MALATRCPHCSTTFRVASDQLKLRGGIVRCGACNEIFDGNAALVELDALPPAIPSPVAPPPAAAATGAPVDNGNAVSTLQMESSFEPAFVPVWLRPQPVPEPEPEPLPEPVFVAEAEPDPVPAPAPAPEAEPALEIEHVQEIEPAPEPEPPPTKPFIPLSIAMFVEPEDMYDEPYAAPYVEPEPQAAAWRGKSKTPWPTIDIGERGDATPGSSPAPFSIDMPIDEEIVAIAPPEDSSEPDFGELSFNEPLLDLNYPSAPVRDANARIEPVFFELERKEPAFVEPLLEEPRFAEPAFAEPSFAEPVFPEDVPAEAAQEPGPAPIVAAPAPTEDELPPLEPEFDEPVHVEPVVAEPDQFLPPLVEPVFDEPVEVAPAVAEPDQFLSPVEPVFEEPVQDALALAVAESDPFLPPLVEPVIDEPVQVAPAVAEAAPFLPPLVEPVFDEPVQVAPAVAEPDPFLPPLVEPVFDTRTTEPSFDAPVRVEPATTKPARIEPMLVEHAYDEPGHTVMVLSYAEETDDHARSDALLNPNTEPLVRDLEHAPLPLLRQSSGDKPASAPVAPPPPPAPVIPEPENDEPDFLRRSREFEEKQGSRRIALLIGSLILAILLVAQGVTTFRNILVAKFPAIEPVLVMACATLGCKLELPAQIDSLSIETGELQSLGANAFNLSTLLRNQSDLTQGWPNIELALTDGNDKTLLRRVVVPAEYLPKGTVIAKGFSARSEQAIKLTFEVKQIKASGYRIAIFYP
ncbi:zinc-ribbon and DUF3426 domain-containing protein [Massilia sp. CCM 8734]|uniref:zinc-ribbon and DUF3426 domain-containing protein n=1 Tax=Massilia sp. CCM 8734 TaxID=2609283 RepID=UPI00141F39E2|nr:zinc-ribbon and DUF3426 domain-containing protein [Massilia sp. CCM 8734]NHZ95649.1 DUF3426 domain-containing protein [Massilia sp. CCM 8734]